MKLPILVERAARATEAQRIDNASKFQLKVEKTSCTTGCASCCYRPISITVLEGIAMYQHLEEHNKWSSTLRDRLLKVGRDQLGTSPEMWLLSLTPCPLLSEDKLCTAYETRPLTCRLHASTGDPHYCHPHHLGPGTQVVPKDGYLDDFLAHQIKLLKSLGLHSVTMPLGIALYFAERLCKGTLQAVNIDHEIVQEYANHG